MTSIDVNNGVHAAQSTPTAPHTSAAQKATSGESSFAQALSGESAATEAEAASAGAVSVQTPPMPAMDTLTAASLQAAQVSRAAYSPAASGSGLQSAILMLCMMLQSGGGGGALGQMMLMLAASIGMLSEDEKETLRRNVMDSGYEHGVLDQVSSQVFHKVDGDATPYEYWKPANPALKNTPGQRSAAAYNAVIDQFGVEQNARYAPYRNGSDTYCNIFLWDVTRAMGAEVPHYIHPVTGDAVGYPPPAGTLETTANRIYDWLEKHGERYGWYEVDEQTAQQAANAGHPALTVRKNPSGHGHVQVVRPSADGAFEAGRGVAVAQAGSRNRNRVYMADLFGESARAKTRYYIHE